MLKFFLSSVSHSHTTRPSCVNFATTKMSSTSTAMKSAQLVLRTAALLDNYHLLGKKRQEQVESEVGRRGRTLQSALAAAGTDLQSIVRATEDTNARIHGCERKLVNMTSEIDALHRARLSQLSQLQNSTEHLQRVNKLKQLASSDLSRLKLNLSQIQQKQYDTEKSHAHCLNQSEQAKQEQLNIEHQVSMLALELERSKKNLASRQQKLSVVDVERRAAEDKFQLLSSQVAKTKHQYESLTTATRHRSLDLHRSVAQLEDGKVELAELEKELKVLEAQQKSSLSKTKQNKFQLKVVRQQIKVTSKKISGLVSKQSDKAPLPLAKQPARLPKKSDGSKSNTKKKPTKKRKRRRRLEKFEEITSTTTTTGTFERL